MFVTMAWAHAKVNEPELARVAVLNALRFAKDPPEIESANRFAEYLKDRHAVQAAKAKRGQPVPDTTTLPIAAAPVQREEAETEIVHGRGNPNPRLPSSITGTLDYVECVLTYVECVLTRARSAFGPPGKQ
jgi:hypothetical protein